MDKKYQISLYRGALINDSCIKDLPQKVVRVSKNPNWGEYLKVTANLEQIKIIQQNLIKHYQGPEPWYTFGFNTDNPDEAICAFGADDGEGGQVFIFAKNDLSEYQKVIDYGLSKGIPRGPMNFLRVR